MKNETDFFGNRLIGKAAGIMKKEDAVRTNEARVNRNCRTLCKDCVFYNGERYYCNATSEIDVSPINGLDVFSRSNGGENTISILNKDLNCQSYVPAVFVGSGISAKENRSKDKAGKVLSAFFIVTIIVKFINFFRR